MLLALIHQVPSPSAVREPSALRYGCYGRMTFFPRPDQGLDFLTGSVIYKHAQHHLTNQPGIALDDARLLLSCERQCAKVKKPLGVGVE